MSELIEHEGIIVSLEGNKAVVKIVQASACSECRAKSMCMSGEAKEKILECDTSGQIWQVGEKVLVLVSERLGWKAILLAYIMPFVVLISVVAGLDMCMQSEALVGTIALCATGVYYIVLSLFKGRLQKQFSFWMKKRVESRG
ncbi:MAG: SoxR reducing system RseC family protein [Bacteroidales bacterium]|nr:SoxR reducing system RseC family protein [Candidatus Colicola coprequi]